MYSNGSSSNGSSGSNLGSSSERGNGSSSTHINSSDSSDSDSDSDSSSSWKISIIPFQSAEKSIHHPYFFLSFVLSSFLPFSLIFLTLIFLYFSS